MQQITLFNMRTLRPSAPQCPPCLVCGHCRYLVTIRNDSNHRWYYCGITECRSSIIGCRPVKTTRAACRRYAAGCGEQLYASAVLKEVPQV